MAARVFVWLGGALFVASLTCCAWWYARVLARPMPAAGWPPILADLALVTIFALHHSVFAREHAKRWLARLVPPELLRSTYVWVASVLLILVCWLWRPIGGDLYHSTGPRAVAHAVIQLAGIWFIARAVGTIDALELSGIRAASHDAVTDGVQTSGPYRWVRHPVYFGWVLTVFGAAHMTGDRLAFAAFTTLYLILAIPWEERSLLRSFGEDYARYTRAVRWRMIPFIY
jgi:protein-S-isoprenylcysteine O-methyltransferase Ste14